GARSVVVVDIHTRPGRTRTGRGVDRPVAGIVAKARRAERRDAAAGRLDPGATVQNVQGAVSQIVEAGHREPHDMTVRDHAPVLPPLGAAPAGESGVVDGPAGPSDGIRIEPPPVGQRRGPGDLAFDAHGTTVALRLTPVRRRSGRRYRPSTSPTGCSSRPDRPSPAVSRRTCR